MTESLHTGQVRWQISTALAYGATGLLYFCWHPMKDGHPGLVQSVVGPPLPSVHYMQAKRLNTWVLALAPTLLHAVPTATLDLRYDRGMIGSTGGSAATMMLRNISRGSWTLGYFKLPSPTEGNSIAVMIANYEHAYTQWANVTFDESAREIDSVSGQPVHVEDDAPDIEGLQLLFAPGAGRLFTFK